MYCKNCGKEIGDSRYCPYCGSVQEDDLSRLEERYGGAKDSAYGAESYYSGGTGYGAAERLREIFELLHGRVVALPVLAGIYAGEISARDPVRLHSQNGFHPGFNSLFKIDYENNII